MRLLGYEVSRGCIKPDLERFEALRSPPQPVDHKSQQRIIGNGRVLLSMDQSFF